MPAQWLRTAIERVCAELRASVGTAVPMAEDLPSGTLRDALTQGRLDDAIAILADATDDASRLRLGNVLLYAGRYEDALAVFEALGDTTGRAQALVELGRLADARALAPTDVFLTTRA